MRDYKGKMNRYKLTGERYEAIRNYCLNINDDTYIMEAIDYAAGDVAPWMLKHITRKGYLFPQMECDGLPCSRDSFRIKRQRVYWYISKILEEREIEI